MATKQKNTKTNVPTIPEIPSDVSPSVKLWLQSTKEALEIRLGRRGDPRDRAITLRELIESGLERLGDLVKDGHFERTAKDGALSELAETGAQDEI